MAINHADWLYLKQGGKCFLRSTPQCRAADGYLHPQPIAKGHKRGWTWEHVLPMSAARRMGIVANRFKLLACRACNNEKGSRMPSDEHLALAADLAREWYTLTIAAQIEDDLVKAATVEEALAQGGVLTGDALERALGRTIPRSYANDPKWRADTAARLGVTDARFLPGAKSR